MATLYSKVESYIREGILSGKWKNGDVLPKETELCQMFGVSRPTVRTALTNLVHEGIIVRIKRKGTVVREWRMLESATVFIESFQWELASKGLDVVTEALEFRCVPPPAIVTEKLDLAPEAMVVKLTRLRYARDSFDKGPVVLTSSYFRESLWPAVQSFDPEHTSLKDMLHSSHFERTVMEKEITIHELTEREARLLGEVPGTSVIQIDTVAWDQNGNKLEFCQSIYPASRNRFLLRIRK